MLWFQRNIMFVSLQMAVCKLASGRFVCSHGILFEFYANLFAESAVYILHTCGLNPQNSDNF